MCVSRPSNRSRFSMQSGTEESIRSHFARKRKLTGPLQSALLATPLHLVKILAQKAQWHRDTGYWINQRARNQTPGV